MIVVAPRSLLLPPDPFARLLGIETPPEIEPLYVLQLVPLMREPSVVTKPAWRRTGNELHGDWIAPSGRGIDRVHAEVELRPLFPLVDWLAPNEEQLCHLYGVDDPAVAARRALDDGVGVVAVTLGGDGCLVATGDGLTHVPARAVTVVDTTGCGDAFSAGLLAGIAQGRDAVGAARFGVVCGSLAATGLGSDAGLTTLAAALDAEATLAEAPPSRRFAGT